LAPALRICPAANSRFRRTIVVLGSVTSTYTGSSCVTVTRLVDWFAVKSAPSVTEDRLVRPPIGEYTFV
jgi:hypothetical protein